MKKLIALVFLLTLFSIPIFAQESTTFEWDLSMSEPLTDGGYKLYASKVSGVYGPADIIATVTAGVNTISIDTTSYRGRWFFTCTAFMNDESGTYLESGYSNEVTAVFKPEAPGTLHIK